MSSFKKAAAADFARQREELAAIAVPRLGPDVFVYYYPAMNVRERLAVMRMYDPDRGGMTPEFYRQAFISRARDEKGVVLFTVKNAHEIDTDFDPLIIEDIVNEMQWSPDEVAPDPKADSPEA